MNEKKRLAVHPRPVYAWTIFGLSVIFIAYAYLLQSTPLLDDITPNSEEHLSKLVYALTGYLYSFTLFQIPVGILIDRFGSRLFPSLGLLFCALGAILLSYAEPYPLIFLAKFIMGLGGAFAFINGLKIISNWFQPKRYAFLVGLFVAFTTLSIILLRTLYKVFKVTYLGWRGATLAFGLGGLIFACIFFFLVQDAPGSRFSVHPPEKKHNFWPNLKHAFNNSQIWVIGITVGMAVGPVFSFETLWSIPFIKQAYKISYQITVMFNLLFVIGYGVGAMYFGRASTSLGRRKVFIPWGIAFTLLMMIIILYPPYMGVNVTGICFFVLGFAASTATLGYVIIHEQNVPQVTATAVAIVNTFYALFASLTQSFVAVFVQLGNQTEHTKIASLQTFQIALVRMPVYVAIAFILSFFIKETYTKQRYSYDD